LATDKPLYKPGETIYGRAALLHAFTRAPVARAVWLFFEVKAPKGDVLFSGHTVAEGGVAAFSWAIPKAQAGGEHKLAVRFAGGEFAPAEAGFSIRSYRVPRLKTELEFLRKAYGPGDTVTAALVAT